MAKLIMLLTKGGKIFEYVSNTPEEALDTYIKEELGFEKKFSMNQAVWQMLSSQTLELDLRILLINSLCKVSNNQIFKVLNSYSVAYPKDPIVYEAINSTTAKVTDCINPMELSVFSIKDKFESKDVITIAAQAFSLDPNLTDIYIPNTITTIEYNAFGACFRLKRVVIPDSVTSIGDFVFKGCSNLESVVIGSGVQTIGKDVFDACTKLTKVYYNGTSQEWANISIATQNQDSILLDPSKIIFKEESPSNN